jgi:hypothetical protein
LVGDLGQRGGEHRAGPADLGKVGPVEEVGESGQLVGLDALAAAVDVGW